MADDSDGKDIACIGRATALGEPPDQKWIDDGKPVLVCDRDVDTEPFAIDPGHAGIYTYLDSKGQKRHVFTYHFYDGEDEGNSKLHARELIWDDRAWPVLTDRVFYEKQ